MPQKFTFNNLQQTTIQGDAQHINPQNIWDPLNRARENKSYFFGQAFTSTAEISHRTFQSFVKAKYLIHAKFA